MRKSVLAYALLIIVLFLTGCATALDRARGAADEGDFETALTEYGTALAEELSPEDRFAALMERGDVYERLDNQAAALADYDTALLLKSEDGSPAGDLNIVNRKQVDLNLALNQFDGATTALEMLIERNPTDRSYILELGDLYTSLQDWQGVVNTMDAALTLFPGDSEMLGQRGSAHLELRNFEQAIEDLKASLQGEVDAATADVDRRSDLVDAYFRLGQALYDLGETESALDNYTLALNEAVNDQDKADIVAERGFIYSELDQYDLALADLDQALVLDPSMAIAYAYRSYVYSDLGDYDLAVGEANRAIELGSELNENTRSAIFHARSWANINIGDYPSAVADATESINLIGADAPDTARTYNLRSQANRYLGNYDQALSDATQAIEIGSTDIGALDGFYYQRSQAYYELGNYEEALADQEAAMAVEAPSAYDYEYLGDIYWAQGDFSNVIANYQTAVSLAPDDPWLQNYLGDAYYEVEDYASAEQQYRQAIAIQNDIALYHENLGLVLRQQENYQGSVDAYSQALTLDSERPYSYYGRGMSYYFLLEDPAARADLQQTLNYDISPDLAGFINEILVEIAE